MGSGLLQTSPEKKLGKRGRKLNLCWAWCVRVQCGGSKSSPGMMLQEGIADPTTRFTGICCRKRQFLSPQPLWPRNWAALLEFCCSEEKGGLAGGTDK